MTIIILCNDGLSEKVLYWSCRKLNTLNENYIMEGVTLSSPEVLNFYLKSIFPNKLSNTFLDFISNLGVTDHRHYDRYYMK